MARLCDKTSAVVFTKQELRELIHFMLDTGLRTLASRCNLVPSYVTPQSECMRELQDCNTLSSVYYVQVGLCTSQCIFDWYAITIRNPRKMLLFLVVDQMFSHNVIIVQEQKGYRRGSRCGSGSAGASSTGGGSSSTSASSRSGTAYTIN